MKVFGDGTGRRLNIAYVWLLVSVQRGGYADGHEVNAFDEAEVSCGRESAVGYKSGQVAVYYVPNVIVAGVYHIHLVLLHVESDGAESGLGLLYGQW